MDLPKNRLNAMAMDSPLPKYRDDSSRIDKSQSEVDSVNMDDIVLGSASRRAGKRFSRTFHEFEGTPRRRFMDNKSSVRR